MGMNRFGLWEKQFSREFTRMNANQCTALFCRTESRKNRLSFPAMQLQYQITLGEFKEMAWLRHRSSVRWILGLCVGAVGLIASAVFYIASDHSFGFFLFTVSLFLILLQCVIPGLIFRRFYRNNIRIFGPRTVTFDETGVTSDHELGRNEAKWSSYEKFRETKNLF